MVQRNALKVWQGERQFKELILEDEEIGKHLSPSQIEEVFSIDYHLKHIDTISDRVFT